MLVLSRKSGQRIKLGNAIRVTVIRVQGDQVRIGIEAPHDVLVLREELSPHELSAHEMTVEVTTSLEPAA
jgi:carbon storage regulator